MKVVHKEWTIESVPEKKGHFWHPRVEVERGPSEGEDAGQIFHFFDLGYYDTQSAAHDRGIAWAQAWLNSNY
jgi:hypothetical protein